jgi:V/A-type H+-transporting ATPase subunit E
MADELQSLLDRIQTDGVAKAEAQGQALIQQSVQKARQIVEAAEHAAGATRAGAEQDAAAFAARGRKSLEQAARDVILTASNALAATMAAVLHKEIVKALTADTLKSLLTSVVDKYFRHSGAPPHIEILLSPQQQSELKDFVAGRFKEELGRGLAIRGDASVLSGFRVTVSGENVEHDLTGEAIAAAMSPLLRPDIAAAVQNALKMQ